MEPLAHCGNELEPFEIRFFANDYISLIESALIIVSLTLMS